MWNVHDHPKFRVHCGSVDKASLFARHVVRRPWLYHNNQPHLC